MHGAAPQALYVTTQTPGCRLTQWDPSCEHPLAVPVPTDSATSLLAVGILNTGMPFPSAQVTPLAGFPRNLLFKPRHCRVQHERTHWRGGCLTGVTVLPLKFMIQLFGKRPWILLNVKTKTAEQPPSL